MAPPKKPRRRARGTEIQRLARAMGLKQSALANAAKCSVSTIKRAWGGDRVPVDLLQTIAEILKVKIEDISDEEQSDSGPSATSADSLQEVLISILERSKITRGTIANHNEIPNPSSSEIAAKLYCPDGLKLLDNCVDQSYSQDERKELNTYMPLLAAALAPLCLKSNDFAKVQARLAEQDGNGIRIATRDCLVAKSTVGFICEVPIASSDINDFWAIGQQDALTGRGLSQAVPFTPEAGGVGASARRRTENIVDDFVRGLIPLVTPYEDNLEGVQAALRRIKERKIHLCVLFHGKIATSELNAVHRSFPELILLMSDDNSKVNADYDALDRYQCVMRYFNPKKRSD